MHGLVNVVRYTVGNQWVLGRVRLVAGTVVKMCKLQDVFLAELWHWCVCVWYVKVAFNRLNLWRCTGFKSVCTTACKGFFFCVFPASISEHAF